MMAQSSGQDRSLQNCLTCKGVSSNLTAISRPLMCSLTPWRLGPPSEFLAGGRERAAHIWFRSSVGQNLRLITGQSSVRVGAEPPIYPYSSAVEQPVYTRYQCQISARSQVRILVRVPQTFTAIFQNFYVIDSTSILPAIKFGEQLNGQSKKL